MKSNTEQLKIAEKYLGESCPKCCHMSNNCCCYFVSMGFKNAGNSSLFYGGKTVTYCPNAIKWCKTTLAQIPPFLAMASDIIFFDWELNGTPNHIGFVDHRIDDQQIATLEGNTTSRGVVANRVRTAKYIQGIFRPHFKGSYTVSKALDIDGQFGYNSIAMFQKALGIKVDGILGKNTIKSWQKKVGVSQDGSWGVNTSKATQRFLKKEGFYKGAIDGCVYEGTVKALQKWINKKVFPNGAPAPKPSTSTNTATVTNGQKIASKANELAYASAPSEAKYPNGHAKAAYKTALEKVYPDRSKWGKAPKVGASCDVFVGTVIRASGVDPKFPRGLAEQRPYLAKSTKFKRVLNLTNRNLKASELKDGDIITYAYKKGGGHICIWYKGKLKHASVNEWYGRTTTEGGRFKISGKKFIHVYRAK